MKTHLHTLAAVLLAPCALFAKTVTLTVDSDTTLSAALTAADTTLESGDTLVKKGLGKLTSDQVFADDFKLAVTVSEGVLEITAPGQLGFTNQIIVENGATLLLTVPKSDDPNNPPVMLKSRTIQLSGGGATGYKGAVVFAGTASWQVMDSIRPKFQRFFERPTAMKPLSLLATTCLCLFVFRSICSHVLLITFS